MFTIAAVLVIAGLSFGLSAASAGRADCGSVLRGGGNAEIVDGGEQLAGTLQGATPDTDATNNQDACRDALDDKKIPTFGLLGIGLLAAIGAVAMPAATAGEKRTD